MKPSQFTFYGVEAALAEINRRYFNDAEERLREKMKPARLAPLQGANARPINFSHVNGDIASEALIAQIRKADPIAIPPAGFIIMPVSQVAIL